MRKTVLVAVFGLVVWAGLGRVGDAQDPIPLYPENYRVVFENDKVRVVDFRLAKGASEKTHSHPAHVAVFLAEFKIRFTLPDGKTALRDGHLGEIAYSAGTTHASENIGDTDAHGILIELKSPPPGASK